MGRPQTGVLGSFPLTLLKSLESLRVANPGWGAGTIRCELLATGRYLSTDLPSVSRISAFLRDKGYTQRYDKMRALPTPAFVQPIRSHETWQIDDQGVEFYKGVGYVRMINIKDVFSHVHIGAFPVLVATKDHPPTTTDYQCALRLAFARFGMPEHIQSDNGSIFHESRSNSPFPTTLHLWLTALGIRFSFARCRRPTDQGTIERTHRTLFNQINRTEPFKNWQHLYEFVQQRVEKLNNTLICQTVNESPLVAFPQAIHSKRYYQPQNEFNLMDLDRVYAFLKHCEWFRKVAPNYNLSLGGHLYRVKEAKTKHQISIKFDEKTQELVFFNDKEPIARKNIKGISKEKMAGQEHTKFCMPGAQFEIPFNWTIIRLSTT